MPTVDVVDLKNKKVGSLDLADAVFGVEVNQDLIYQAVHNYRACAARRDAQDQDPRLRCRARAASCGGRRAPGGRAWVRSVRRCGATAARCMARVPRDYSYKLPKKMLLGAIRSALSARLADGAIKVVQSFDLEGHKTRGFSEILGALETGTTVLLVEDSDNRNLELSSRNLPGRDPAERPRSASLSSAGSRAGDFFAGGGGKMQRGAGVSPYQVIQGPLITEKSEGKRALEQTLCFRVHPRRHQDRYPQRRAAGFQGQG